MTQKKDLLLKDLCARFPYGVKVQYRNYIGTIDLWTTDYKFTLLVDDNIQIPDVQDSLFIEIEDIKPYLFPLSSMTEEERNEYKHFVAFSGNPTGSANFIDWLNAHHFDYRGLIKKGLAIDATNKNIY